MLQAGVAVPSAMQTTTEAVSNIVYREQLEIARQQMLEGAGFTQPLIETGLFPGAAKQMFKVGEETGIDASRHPLTDWRVQNRFEIFRRWGSRFAPGTTHNVERVFGLTLPQRLPVVLSPREHLRYQWLPWHAAAERVFSWTNADALRLLPIIAAESGAERGA